MTKYVILDITGPWVTLAESISPEHSSWKSSALTKNVSPTEDAQAGKQKAKVHHGFLSCF